MHSAPGLLRWGCRSLPAQAERDPKTAFADTCVAPIAQSFRIGVKNTAFTRVQVVKSHLCDMRVAQTVDLCHLLPYSVKPVCSTSGIVGFVIVAAKLRLLLGLFLRVLLSCGVL